MKPPRLIHSVSINGGEPKTWRVPTRAEALARSRETWAKQYDRVERRTVEGGLPILFEQVTP